MDILSLNFPSCQMSKQWGIIRSLACETGRTVPAVTSLVMEGGLQDCLLLEASVWLV